MSDTTQAQGEGGGPQAGAARSLPIAAIAGALVLVGLVGIALYRRSAGPPAGAAGAAVDAATPADAAGTAASEEGTAIAVKAPTLLSPEAAILAERYRCVCGCNDPLGVCTCRLPGGSEDMKAFLQDLARQGRTPDEVDREMTAMFGATALLSNPAPPQTQPSHAAR
jgi:hypothetical protein